MSSAQTWDPALYARNARFVSDLGSPILELLAPLPGQRILDLGCGDGALTSKLVDLQCEVVAIDSSAPQIEAARKRGLDAHVMDAEALPFREEFDAVFSNAVLHWITRADPMIAAVYRSLRPGGRFVAECGGRGCVHTIRTALVEALDRRGIDGEARVPWYFPTPGDYATRLERAGFRVDSIALIPRPTPLPGDVIDWLETFAHSFLQGLTGAARAEYLAGGPHRTRAAAARQHRNLGRGLRATSICRDQGRLSPQGGLGGADRRVPLVLPCAVRRYPAVNLRLSAHLPSCLRQRLAAARPFDPPSALPLPWQFPARRRLAMVGSLR